MHAVYETDAVERLHQHLGKVVRVTLSNKRQITGTVFTIDPVSRRFVIKFIIFSKYLHIFFSYKLILGHND